MRLVNKTSTWNSSKTWEGKKKNYKVLIRSSNFSIEEEYWFFTLVKDSYHYNSLWDNDRYRTKEEAAEAAENKINELTKIS